MVAGEVKSSPIVDTVLDLLNFHMHVWYMYMYDACTCMVHVHVHVARCPRPASMAYVGCACVYEVLEV